MRVEILYFGVLREMVGVSQETCELKDEATVGELLRVLRGRAFAASWGDRAEDPALHESRNSFSPADVDAERGSYDGLWRGLAVAVNREYCSQQAVLRDGDEVALLPPVSGGCCARQCYAEAESARTAKVSFPGECKKYCGKLALLADERSKSG